MTDNFTVLLLAVNSFSLFFFVLIISLAKYLPVHGWITLQAGAVMQRTSIYSSLPMRKWKRWGQLVSLYSRHSSYSESIFKQLFIITLYTGKCLICCRVDSNWDFILPEVICLIGSRSYQLLDNYWVKHFPILQVIFTATSKKLFLK